MNQLNGRYLEDFAVGQTFGSGRLRIDKQQIFAFAGEFDPQPFHLDEAAARHSIFGGLAASGWHTAAVTMRLLVDSELKPAGGFIGAGLDECRWPLEPGWRGGVGACRKPRRAAPERYSTGLTVEFTSRREAHPSEPATFRARGTGVPLPCLPDCRSWQRLPEGSDPSGR